MTELYINANELKTLPNTLWTLSSLTKFEVYKNKLQQLDNAVCKLTNLSHLDIGHNQLTSLPYSLTRCKKLILLRCAFNPLDIPSEVVWSGEKAIFSYLHEMQKQNGVQVARRNIFVVGDPMAGKTSYIKSPVTGKENGAVCNQVLIILFVSLLFPLSYS